jgi:hypothetical protein
MHASVGSVGLPAYKTFALLCSGSTVGWAGWAGDSSFRAYKEHFGRSKSCLNFCCTHIHPSPPLQGYMACSTPSAPHPPARRHAPGGATSTPTTWDNTCAIPFPREAKSHHWLASGVGRTNKITITHRIPAPAGNCARRGAPKSSGPPAPSRLFPCRHARAQITWGLRARPTERKKEKGSGGRPAGRRLPSSCRRLAPATRAKKSYYQRDGWITVGRMGQSVRVDPPLPCAALPATRVGVALSPARAGERALSPRSPGPNPRAPCPFGRTVQA